MFYLVRHGEPDYSERNSKIYQGFGMNMCPLTENGREQIKNAAKDPRLKGADIILASPYTRALQTAAILSKELGADILVETDLHEWVANKNYIFASDEEAQENYRDFIKNNYCYPAGRECDWESYEIMKERVSRVLRKYEPYNKVVVACHGTLMQVVTGLHRPMYGEIFEFELENKEK